MRRLVIFVFCLGLSVFSASAQGDAGGRGKGNFNPKDFELRLEKHVLKEAGITKAEAEKFLPLYRGMRKKQIETMDAERKSRGKKVSTEKEWEALMKAHDNTEIQLKRIAQAYHNKMLTVIPASKIMKVIKAENEFFQDMFRQMHSGKDHPHPDGRESGRHMPGQEK